MMDLHQDNLEQRIGIKLVLFGYLSLKLALGIYYPQLPPYQNTNVGFINSSIMAIIFLFLIS